MEDKLFDLGVVCRVAIVVDTTGFVPCAAHDPPTSRDQNKLKAILGALIINVALNETDEPVRCDPLCLKVFTHIEVPHVASVHCTFITNKGL